MNVRHTFPLRGHIRIGCVVCIAHTTHIYTHMHTSHTHTYTYSLTPLQDDKGGDQETLQGTEAIPDPLPE